MRVVVRVKPLTDEDDIKEGGRTIRCCNPKTLEVLSTTITSASASGAEKCSAEEIRMCAFDICAHERFTQYRMFSSCGLMPLLSAAVDGYADVQATSESTCRVRNIE